MTDFRRLVLCILLVIGFAIVLHSCTTVSPTQMTGQNVLGKQILSEQNEHYNLLSAHKECHFFRFYFDCGADFQNSSSPIVSRLNISF